MASHNSQSITCVGHPLGGVLAELDPLFLTLNSPSSTTIRAFTYGMPRVGNPAFAQLIGSAKVPNYKQINNEEDVVPIVPGRFLGFNHPTRELPIISPGNTISCPGDDDGVTDSQCTIETVLNV